MTTTVAGTPLCYSLEVERVPQKVSCPQGKEIAIRNTGTNTLWLSLDKKVWFDVACGTSWDARLEASHFWVRTKIGCTNVVILVTT